VTQPFDIFLSEVFLSRICHDLINPVSAAKGGFDLLNDSTTPQDRIDIEDFTKSSVQQALFKLTLMRSALGYNTTKAICNPKTYQKILDDFFSSQQVTLICINITQHFTDTNGSDDKLRAVLILALCLSECYMFSPNLQINFNNEVIDLQLTGTRLIIRQDILDSLSQLIVPEQLSSKNVFSYLLQQYMTQKNMRLDVIEISPLLLHIRLTSFIS